MPITVRLLSTYDGNAPNTIVTLPDAVATQLLAGNVGATLDLTGGVTKYQDVDASVSGSTVGPNRRSVITVPEARALSLKGSIGARGTLETINAAGAVIASQALTSAGVRPLQGGKTYRVTSTYGTFTVQLQDSRTAYNQTPRFDVPVKVATWGDSLTDTSNVLTHDLTAATRPLFDQTDLYGSRLAHNMLFYSGGCLIPVANCGQGGTTSPTIIARDIAAIGINRRGATDAFNLGAQVCVISLGRNDVLSTVRANTTPAAQQTILDAIYANVATAVRRAQRLGMYPILREFAGYGYEDSPVNYAKGANLTPEDVAVQVALLNTAHRYILDVIVPTLGDMSVLPIRDGMVDPATGAWYPQFSTDGLHENRNGAREVARRLTALVMSMAKPYQPSRYAPLPEGAGRLNGFAAPAMVSITSGRAAGFLTSTQVGTVTITPSVTEDADGTIWQNALCAATVLDGVAKVGAPNGLAASQVSMQMSTWGATPALPVLAGDLVRVEFDLVIDDGAGGVPTNVLTWFSQVSIGVGAGAFFRVRPVEQNANSAGLCSPDQVIAGKVISLPISMPLNSADMDNGLVAVTVHTNDLRPFRIRVSNPRFIKYPAAK